MYTRKSIHADAKKLKKEAFADQFLECYLVWEVNGQGYYKDNKGKIRRITKDEMLKRHRELENFWDE